MSIVFAKSTRGGSKLVHAVEDKTALCDSPIRYWAEGDFDGVTCGLCARRIGDRRRAEQRRAEREART